MLPKEAIKEFKEIYRKEYGTELSEAEASLHANNLIQLYKPAYQKFMEKQRENHYEPDTNKNP